MHNRELEGQLEESKECISRLLTYFLELYETEKLDHFHAFRALEIKDAEKLLERLNG